MRVFALAVSSVAFRTKRARALKADRFSSFGSDAETTTFESSLAADSATEDANFPSGTNASRVWTKSTIFSRSRGSALVSKRAIESRNAACEHEIPPECWLRQVEVKLRRRPKARKSAGERLPNGRNRSTSETEIEGVAPLHQSASALPFRVAARANVSRP